MREADVQPRREFDHLDDPGSRFDDPASDDPASHLDDPASRSDDPASHFDDPASRFDDPASDDPGSAERGDERPERRPALTRVRRWLVKNGWLVLAAGAALVLANVVEFRPPDQVRIDDATVDLVGEAPNQEFDQQLANPQSVQMRATLRLYPRADMDVREPDPDVDAKARVLSQPVVTTIYAMNANIDQTVRLDGGDLEIDIELAGTPRLGEASRNRVPPLSLEHELTVDSRRKRWLREPVEQVHLHTRGTLVDLEARPARWVFVVEGKLFALDLELNRAV